MHRRWIALGIVAALLIGCGSTPATQVAPTAAALQATEAPKPATELATSAPTDEPKPSNTPEPPTAAPAPTALPTAAAPPLPLQSGGLGLTRAEWEQRHGSGTEDTLGYAYENKQYLVMYQADPDGVETVWSIEQRFGTGGVGIDDARAISALLLPLDRALTKTYMPTEGRTVDLYRSDWLKGRFPATMKIGKLELPMWTNGEPGDFIALYRVATGKVASLIIGIGNNP